MESLYVLFVILAAVTPIAGLVVAIYAVRKSRRLEDRIEDLEYDVEKIRAAARTATPDSIPSSIAPPVPVMSPAAPTPPARPLPQAIEAPTPMAAPAPPPAPTPTPALAAASTLPATPERVMPSGLEQLIGGVWLQNIGSILLLLGSFFLIVWGYTQGRVGPEALVIAGVVVGVLLAWRGDRAARTLRALGHALLGVGLGVVYMTIYLGHFRMHVLPGWAAFSLLALVSYLTVNIGLRRAQPAIATFGIVGAFMPLILSAEEGMGFRLPFSTTLGYLALTNAVVVALTALRGWSGLVILSLDFSGWAWVVTAAGTVWPTSAEIGLGALFTALGMAPIARLARLPDSIRPVDLAVVVSAPFVLLVASLPYFATAASGTSGAILLGLAGVNAIAAIWVDARRENRDLWRPLTAIATIFLTAALERFLARENLALAWVAEGAVLAWLGLSPRGGWFRLLGYVVSALAGLRLLFAPGVYDPARGGATIGILTGDALRDLACIAILIATAEVMHRRREHLAQHDPHAPGTWFVAANLLILAWTFREAGNVAKLLAPFPLLVQGTGAPDPEWTKVAAVAVVTAAWSFHALVLIALARLRRSAIHRHVAYGVGAVTLVSFVAATAGDAAWTLEAAAGVYPIAIILAAAVLAFGQSAVLLARERADGSSGLGTDERLAPDIAKVSLHVALMIWSARVAVQAARALTPGTVVGPMPHDATAILASVLTSAAWMAQAGILFAIGWSRRTPFDRWLGLVLVGLTLVKFAIADLQSVDIFWRFVIAIGIGAALLAGSFLYQRALRSERRGQAEVDVPTT